VRSKRRAKKKTTNMKRAAAARGWRRPLSRRSQVLLCVVGVLVAIIIGSSVMLLRRTTDNEPLRGASAPRVRDVQRAQETPIFLQDLKRDLESKGSCQHASVLVRGRVGDTRCS